MLLTSGGLGAMGFGLPAAIGVVMARTDAIVVYINGDGSFMVNVQELANIRYCKANRADSYLGNPSNDTLIFPNMLKFAEACGIPAARVTKAGNLRVAIQTMLDTLKPYLLDVIVPHWEHVLPMIPIGTGLQRYRYKR
ncbi:ALS SURB: Acetolactate synthase 2 chloroplastic [Bienertia sinuspersici]